MYYGLVVGDSISDGSTEWPTKLDQDAKSTAVGGATLVGDIEPSFASDLAGLGPLGHYVVIQGGVNDAVGLESLANMQTALTSMVTQAKAGDFSVFVMSIAPFKNGASWSESAQTIADNYNAWLATQDVVQGFTFLDVYAPLEDDITADALEADYDSGDGVHPNDAGQIVIANIANTEINQLTRPVVGGSNVNKAWRGAVEPAESGASGNEIQLWRGAVEPAAVSSSLLINGITRNVTRNITRNVTENWSW